MRKKRVYLMVVAVALLVGLFFALSFRSREPEYGGKKLSAWIDLYKIKPEERQEALTHMGTNALPWLLNWFQYERPPWKHKLYGIANPFLTRFHAAWRLTDEKEFERGREAWFALVTLCEETEVAVDELSKLLNDRT